MGAQHFGGNWTAIKLAKLKDYIDAYMRVMKNQRFKLTYIDAFLRQRGDRNEGRNERGRFAADRSRIRF